MFYRSWSEAGVKYIKDLITEDGSFMTFSVFQHTFRIKTHFLQFLGLLNAILKSWKKKFNNSYKENETNDCEIKIIDTQNISSKMLRNILTKKCFERPTSMANVTNVTFAASFKHRRISLLNVIFGLILLLGGIVRITRKSNSNSVIFYLLFILENSPL